MQQYKSRFWSIIGVRPEILTFQPSKTKAKYGVLTFLRYQAPFIKAVSKLLLDDASGQAFLDEEPGLWQNFSGETSDIQILSIQNMQSIRNFDTFKLKIFGPFCDYYVGSLIR